MWPRPPGRCRRFRWLRWGLAGGHCRDSVHWPVHRSRPCRNEPASRLVLRNEVGGAGLARARGGAPCVIGCEGEGALRAVVDPAAMCVAATALRGRPRSPVGNTVKVCPAKIRSRRLPCRRNRQRHCFLPSGSAACSLHGDADERGGAQVEQRPRRTPPPCPGRPCPRCPLAMHPAAPAAMLPLFAPSPCTADGVVGAPRMVSMGVLPLGVADREGGCRCR